MPRGLRNAIGVTFGVRILGLDRGRQAEDDLLGAVEPVVDQFQAQCRAYAGDELQALDGFRHEIIGAGLERLHAVFRAIERCDHHHRHQAQRGVGLDAPAHRVSVHAGHLDVEQDQVWGNRLDCRQRAGAVACEPNLALDVGQASLDELAVRRAVVDHEH